MKQRDLTIDISKGIGIILVVIGHLTIFSQSFTDVTESIYLFHMPLFFILSGFYCKPSQDFQTYMSNKTKRLFTPFFFYCVFQYLVTLLFAILPWRGVESFLHAIDNFNTWGLWFLVSLWSCYLLHWFVMRVRYHWAVVLMIAALGAALVDIQLRQPFYITQTTLAYPFFYLGYHFKNTKIRGAGMYERLVGYRYKWALLLLSVTVLFCHDYDIQMDMIAIEAPAFPLFYLYAIAGSLLVVLLSNHLMGVFRQVSCLSWPDFLTYLWHT